MFVLVTSLALAAFMYVKCLYENGKLNMFTTSAPSNNAVNECTNETNNIVAEPVNIDTQNYN